MSDRDKFIADIIAELSKQKESNNGSLEITRKISEVDVFKKLCYSYPLVNTEDVQDLSIAVEKIVKKQTTPIGEVFCLDETFIDNLRTLSDNSEGGSLRNTTQLIAAIVFLKFPKHLLSCNKRQLSSLFTNYDHSSEWGTTRRTPSLSWLEIINSFRELIFKCSSSYMSELTLAVFNDGFHLVSLLSAISTFEKMIQLSEEAIVSEHDELEALKEIEDNSDSDYLTLEGVLHRLIKEVITANPVNKQTKESEEEEVNQFPIVTKTIISSLKEMWLHLIFIYRDILIRIPALVPSYLPPLCDVLVTSSASSNNSTSTTSANNDMSSLFNFDKKSTGPKYPSSSECIFAMVLSNLSSYLTAETITFYSEGKSKLIEDASLNSARTALRDYLTSKQKLSTLVDIWERMNAKPKISLLSKNKNKEPTPVVINVESCNFLLDVAMLYVCDLSNGTYTYAMSGVSSKLPTISTAKHFEALVTSRIVPCLLSVLVNIIQLSFELCPPVAKPPTIKISNGSTTAVSSLCLGLLKFLTFACIHDSGVSTYIHNYPDLMNQLSQVISVSWGPIVQQLKTTGSISHEKSSVIELLSFFSPADAFGFLVVILLKGLSTSASTTLYSTLLQVCEVLEQSLLLIKYETTLSVATTSSDGDSDYVVVSKNTAENSSDDAEYEEVSEKNKTASSQKRDYSQITSTLNKVNWMLTLLLSNKDGATLMKGLFKPITVMSTESVLMMRIQQLFKSFVDNMLLMITTQMKTIQGETIIDVNELQTNVSKVILAHENVKKQLKALQVMSQGFTSNKTD